jgi:hypothetical protein
VMTRARALDADSTSRRRSTAETAARMAHSAASGRESAGGDKNLGRSCRCPASPGRAWTHAAHRTSVGRLLPNYAQRLENVLTELDPTVIGNGDGN